MALSQPGIEPMPPALEGQNLNHWTTREVLFFAFFFLLKNLIIMDFGRLTLTFYFLFIFLL